MAVNLSANSPVSSVSTKAFAPHHQRTKKGDHLTKIKSVSKEDSIKIPKLELNSAVSHIKSPVADWGHKATNSKRVLTDLGESVFSLLFKAKDVKSINAPPEHDNNFMSLIEEIERYMYEIIAMPNYENEMQEDMRKHKKFIQESLDDLEFLERHFGIVRMPGSAMINIKKLRPVVLDIDASGDRF